MLENIFRARPQEKGNQNNFGEMKVVKEESKYQVNPNTLDSFKSAVAEFQQELDTLKKSIAEKREKILNLKVEKEQAFKNTEIGKEITQKGEWLENIAKQEMQTMEKEPERSAMFKDNKLDLTKEIGEKYAYNEEASAYSKEQAEFNKLLVDLDNLERKI